MKLLTEELKRKLPALNAQDGVDDKIVYIKFFHPVGSWSWFAVEGQQEGDDFLFFGCVHGFEREWGYFSLNELQSVKGPMGLGIERDLYFKPTPYSAIGGKD